MELAWLITAIIGIVASVDSGVANWMARDRNSKLASKTKDLAAKMTKDTELMNQLTEAYNRRDSELAQNIMMSSPFSTRLKALKGYYEANKHKMNELNKTKVSTAEEQSALNARINEIQAKSNTTGSAIADLISGTATMSVDPGSYKGSGYSNEDLKGDNK